MNIFHLDLEKRNFERFPLEEEEKDVNKAFKFKFFALILFQQLSEKKKLLNKENSSISSGDNGKNIFSDVIYEWTMSEWVCAMKEERIFSDGDESWIAFCEIDG